MPVSFTASRASTNISVTDTSSGVGTIISWTWQFSNLVLPSGAFNFQGKVGQSPSAFTDNGVSDFAVELTILNSIGEYHSVSQVFLASNSYTSRCAPSFSSDPSPFIVGESVTLTDTSSGAGPIVRRRWSGGLGNDGYGNVSSITENSAVHIYSESLSSHASINNNTTNLGGYYVSVKDTNFTYLPNPVDVGSIITFTLVDYINLSATDYYWDFDDGNTSTDANPTHSYSAPGNYSVSFIASNPELGWETIPKVHIINVVDVQPTATFSHTPEPQIIGAVVTFTDTSIGVPTEWLWDFGDGNSSTEQNPTHIYNSTGIFTVQLDVSNTAGTDSITHDIIIEHFADFTSPDLICRNVPVIFTDTSSGGGITSWDWEFDDGTVGGQFSSDPNPIITYPNSGTYNVTLTVTNTTTIDVIIKSITVYNQPNISTLFLLDGIYNTAYSDIILYTGLGGETGFTFDIISGTLPEGLSLNSSTGEISGTVTSLSGNFSFTIRLTSSHGCIDEQVLSINVTTTPLNISTTVLPGSCRGIVYNQTLEAADGIEPYIWEIIEGLLPTTLSLNASTGEITGTVDADATVQIYNFTVEVTDDNSDTATRPLSIEVYPEPEWITISLPNGNVSVNYDQTVIAIDGLGYGGVSGTLPNGLTFDSSGQIHGIPTVEGSFDFVARATSVNGCYTDQPFHINIGYAPPTLAGTFQNVCNNVSYYNHLTAAGGTPPYTYAVTGGTLPQQLALGATSGSIQGITAEPGDFTFDITVTDTLGVAGTYPFSLTVYDSPVIKTPAPYPGVYGREYPSYTFSVIGGTPPIIWSLNTVSTPLPNGLTFNSIYGTISGTPVEFGYFPLDISVYDSHECTGNIQTKLIISGPPDIDKTIVMPPACEGEEYSFYIPVFGGIPDYYWFVTSDNYPPQNLVLNPYTGKLSGIPLKAGSYPFTIKVVDQNNLFVTKDYTLIVRTAQECGQGDEKETITITKSRLTSLESTPVFVVDPFHQKYLHEYLPVPFNLDDK